MSDSNFIEDTQHECLREPEVWKELRTRKITPKESRVGYRQGSCSQKNTMSDSGMSSYGETSKQKKSGNPVVPEEIPSPSLLSNVQVNDMSDGSETDAGSLVSVSLLNKYKLGSAKSGSRSRATLNDGCSGQTLTGNEKRNNFTDWRVKVFPAKLDFSDEDEEEEEETVIKVDESAQTVWSLHEKKTSEIQVEAETKPRLAFINAVIKLKNAMWTRKEMSKKTFTDILKSISPKSDVSGNKIQWGSPSPKRTRESEPESRGSSVSPSGEANILLQPKRRNPGILHLPLKTIEPQIINPNEVGFSQSQKEVDFQPKPSMSYGFTAGKRMRREEDDNEKVPMETVRYLMRQKDVDATLEKEVKAVLSYLEDAVHRDVEGIAFYWKNSTVERAVGILCRAADTDVRELRKMIFSVLQRTVDDLFEDRSKKKDSALECQEQFLAAFSRSTRLSFDLIHYIVKRVKVLKEIHLQLQYNDWDPEAVEDTALRQLDTSYYLLRLLRELLAQFFEKFKEAGENMLSVPVNPSVIGVLELWRKKWGDPESAEEQAKSFQGFDYLTTFSQWLTVLEDLLQFCIDEIPIYSHLLWESVTIVKEMIKCRADMRQSQELMK